MKTYTIAALSSISVFLASPASAEDYYNQKWFDYPDPFTAPRVTQTGCGKQACTDIPEFHGLKIEMHQQCMCISPNISTELLRHDVRVVVAGPSANADTVKKAVEGYVAGCVVTAIAASTAGPQVVASPAGFFATFKGCVAALSLSGTVGAILNQVNIHIDTNETHWAPL